MGEVEALRRNISCIIDLIIHRTPDEKYSFRKISMMIDVFGLSLVDWACC
jgi:hypothetical protein